SDGSNGPGRGLPWRADSYRLPVLHDHGEGRRFAEWSAGRVARSSGVHHSQTGGLIGGVGLNGGHKAMSLIAHVGGSENRVGTNLPLDGELVVLRIGQLVPAIEGEIIG